jgi:hypothetical protein
MLSIDLNHNPVMSQNSLNSFFLPAIGGRKNKNATVLKSLYYIRFFPRGFGRAIK